LQDLEDLYELSPMQQGLLFHTLYSPGSGLYCEQLACTLSGHLDTTAFEKAWRQVVERHAVLRTSFHWEDVEKPLQAVFREVEIPWEKDDLSALPPEEQAERLAAFLERDRHRGFTLTEAPLVRFALFKLADNAWRFVFTSHHLLMDGWCMPILFGEVFALYSAAASGQAVRLPRPRPYRDYIVWLQKQDPEEAERFFRHDLAGITSPTPLPGDRGAQATTEFAELEEILPFDVSVALTAAAREQQLTINTLVQGAWAVLLARGSGERKVVFGATVSGRPPELPGVESMIGLFINSLPVRVTVAPEAPLWELLRELQARHAESRHFEYTPLVDIQSWSQIPRGRPLFESLLVFENYPVEGGGGGGGQAAVSIGDVRGSVEATNYPMTLMGLPGTPLILRISFFRGRFDDATIRRTLGQLAALLAGMLEKAPGRELTLSDLPSLSPAERQQIAVEWNDTAMAAPFERTVAELVAGQVAARPEAPAVVWEGGRLTYAELWERAGVLAARLVELGVGPETRVALFAERGAEAIWGLLGILRAGGAYLPIDPAYPAERALWMVEDGRVRVVLTERALTGRLPALPEPGGSPVDGAPWVLLLDEMEDSPVGAGPPVLPRVDPDNLAYVMYTSGSTGRPKGVGVSHRNVVRLVCGGGYADLGPEQVWMQFTSLSFDPSVLEIWGALANGGCLALAPAGPEAIDELSRVIAASGVTSLWLTAGLFHQMDDGRLAGLRPLRQLLAGGDVLSAQHSRRVLETLPGLLLVDGYGPTEVTTFTTCNPMREPADVGETVSIGRPVPNTQVYLLDRDGGPVPVGVYGELVAGGHGVARGYLGRPELTAERFVPDPFGPPGSRLYRTGDLVRYQEDGRLDFLGRRDFQVKLRGFRIELGEIESVLSSHPEVADAAVLVREDTPGDKKLLGYVRPQEGSRPMAAVLRLWLRDRLPEYMVPASIAVLDRFPLQANGKVDRKALALVDPAGEGAGEAGYEAPRTAFEELVASVWRQVLSVPRVGVRDNFFELGGHSLIATQMSSRLRDTFGIEVPISLVFEHPDMADFALAVERRIAGDGDATTVLPDIHSVRPEDFPHGFPLSFSQERQWLFDQRNPRSSTYNIPQAMWAEGAFHVDAFRDAIGEIVRRHGVLRTTFDDLGHGPVQLVAPALDLPLPEIDLSGLPGPLRERVAWQLAEANVTLPFDLRRGPLLRIQVVKAREDERALLFSMHHIISDGWSMGVFTREVTTLYAAALEGRDLATVLPPLPLQFVDFAVWQRQSLGRHAAPELDYWRAQLAGLPLLLELPTDRPRPPMQTFAGNHVLSILGEDIVLRLGELTSATGTTTFMVLLAAFQMILSRHAGQDDLAVGSPIAGRSRVELEPLIGFFVNAIVLRARLTGDLTFTDLLRQVRHTTLGAYAHPNVPFARLVEELRPERNPSYSPLFQVMFGLLDNPAGDSGDLPGIELKQMVAENRTAKYDLGVTTTTSPRSIVGEIEYNSDLFDRSTIVRLVRQYETLILTILDDPEKQLSALLMLTPAERHQVTFEWNANEPPHRFSGALDELVAAQAARTPDAIALIAGEERIPYRELEERANRLARYLVRRGGLGPERVVGVRLARTAELIVALLAVHKTGAAYMPLELA
jgi:amino acid adenylation domain-containing protein